MAGFQISDRTYDELKPELFLEKSKAKFYLGQVYNIADGLQVRLNLGSDIESALNIYCKYKYYETKNNIIKITSDNEFIVPVANKLISDLEIRLNDKNLKHIAQDFIMWAMCEKNYQEGPVNYVYANTVLFGHVDLKDHGSNKVFNTCDLIIFE